MCYCIVDGKEVPYGIGACPIVPPQGYSGCREFFPQTMVEICEEMKKLGNFILSNSCGTWGPQVSHSCTGDGYNYDFYNCCYTPIFDNTK